MIKLFCSVLGLVLLSQQTVLADIPRTPDGKPDLSGFFDTATLTPLQRSEELGEKGFITQAEAEKIATAVATTRSKSSLPSDPNRGAPESGGDGTAGAGGGVGGYNDFWLDYGSGRFKLRGQYPTSIITYPENGRYPEMTPLGEKRMAVALSDFRLNTGKAWWLDQAGSGPFDNMEQRPLRERCLLGFGPAAGPPTIPSAYNNLKRIIQTEDSIMILAEMVHDVRVIPIGRTHNPDNIRYWMGDSVGRWEGDVLIVETVNFKSEPGLTAADENLHVIERFSRIDGATLLYQFEVSNPTVWTDTWKGEYPWPQTQDKVYEYACHEGNYALGNIMCGARMLENDLLSGASSGGQE